MVNGVQNTSWVVRVDGYAIWAIQRSQYIYEIHALGVATLHGEVRCSVL